MATTTRAGGSSASTGAGQAIVRAPRGGVKITKKPKRDSLSDFEDQLLARSAPSAPEADEPEVRVGGLTAEQIAEFRRRGLSTGGRSVGGFLQNLAAGGLDIVTSVPAQAQLLAEAALYAPVAGYNQVTGNRRGGNRGDQFAQGLEDQIASDLADAGRGVKDDYSYRWGPLFRGDVGTFGARFYDDPTPTILDVAGAKSVVGRTPNAARRAVRAAAPASRAGQLADRALSTLSAEDRAAFAGATGKQITPGPGGRYRPPKQVRSTVARAAEDGPVVGERIVEVPRRPYSGDAFARTRQRIVDRANTGRVEESANRRQVAAQPTGTRPAPLRERFAAATTRRSSSQAKFDRVQRAETRTLQDLMDAKAEVAVARSRGKGKSAIAQLKGDRIGRRKVGGLSIEEAAFALHRMDMLGDVKDGVRQRGGLSAVALRDEYLRRIEGEQRAAKSRGLRVENSAAQAQIIRAIPDELLDLTDMKNPTVRRVAAAVEEARRLNANAQLRSVEAGVVKPGTVAAAARRDSGIGVGGVRLGRDAMRQVSSPRTTGKRAGGKTTTRYALQVKAIDRKIAAARAAKDPVEVRRLKAERQRIVRATKAKVAAIRRDATRETPELKAARAKKVEADRKLNEATDKRSVSAATRSRDVVARQVKKLEDDALGFTSPRRPELVGDRGVYVPDTPIDVRTGYTGPKKAGRMSGPDKARRSEGRLKARGNIDLNPAAILHQHARAMQNYTGRISRQALDELLNSSAYRDPKTGQALTGERLRLLSSADSERVQLVHVGNLRKALHELDVLPEGRFLDDVATRQVFIDQIPKGARASDYVAISKAAADVWTESMTSNAFLKGLDKGLNYWKGGLLALSPRWYVNGVFGLALQYGMMTGLDLRSIRMARRRSLGRAMENRSPNAIKDTMADDLTGGDIPKLIAFGFRINNNIEQFWRRAAYLNRAKKAIRNEGGKFRSLSDAEIARAIENMPESMALDIARDLNFFIGDYRKYTKFERDFVKRLVPFYGWLRVAARLTFALPFRSPGRAALMNTLSIAAEAGINPNDKALDYFERGALQIGGKAIPTWGLNPLQTLAPVLVAFGEANPIGALGEESVGWVHPGIQFLTSLAFGTNNFGQGVTSPPGTASFGQDPETFNPVTGRPSRQRLRMPFKESFLQASLPGQVSVIRRVAAGGRSPYDTVETADVIADYFNRMAGAPRNERLYRPVSKRAGRVADPKINPWSTAFGVPVYDQDDAALVKEAKKRLDDFYANQKKLARTRKRAERG